MTIKSDWDIPVGLMALILIPHLAGAARISSLSGNGPVTLGNIRFFTAPLPVILHIISTSHFCTLGTLQFSPGFRRSNLVWHRISGCLLFVSGFVAALTGIWMTLTYSIVPADNDLLHFFRLVFGTLMSISLITGLYAILNRDIMHHQAWMNRAFAIAMGAGTQAVTQLPVLLLFGEMNAMSKAMMMGAAWIINLAVAEFVNHKQIKAGFVSHL